MRCTAVIVVLFALLSAHAVCAAEDTTAPGVETVAKNLYLVTGLDGGNVAFQVTDDGVLVVDAGSLSGGGRAVVEQITRTTKQPIRYVILTHHHMDHTFGLSAFPPSATIVAHENLPDQYRANVVDRVPQWIEKVNQEDADLQKKAADMEESKPEEAAKIREEIRQNEGFLPEMKAFKAVYPQITFSDKLTIRLGGQRVEAFFPGSGHTNDNVVVYFPQLKVVHVGDLVFNGAYPYILRKSGANTASWISDLNRIQKLEPETVIPGHGAVAGPDALQRQIDYLTDLRTAVRAAMDEGKSLEEAKRSVRLPAWEQLKEPELLPLNIEAVYSELKEAAGK